MPKVNIGDVVIYSEGPKREFARVVDRDGRRYRLFTIRRRQISADARHIRYGKPAVLILESNLSHGREALRTDKQRRSGLFLEEFFRSLDFLVLREKVHTASSLEYFMRYARGPDILFVHWTGHGLYLPRTPSSQRTSFLMLSTEFIYLPEDPEAYLRSALERGVYRRQKMNPKLRRLVRDDIQQYERLVRIFSGLQGKVLLFSTCDVGKQNGLAQYVSQISGAKAVITYDADVSDHEANVAESLLYLRLHTMETKRRPPGVIVTEVRQTLKESLERSIPLVCYVNGNKKA